MRHTAQSQVEKAIAEIEDSDLSIGDTVHQIRKRCKKVRGLIRLVRPRFDAYALENAAFRDEAANLSFVRDAEAILETHDALIKYYSDQIDTSTYLTIRHQFVERKEGIVREKELEEKLVHFRDAMTEAKARIRDWHIGGDGFVAVAGGFGKTYKRSRKALAEASEQPTAESIHEWRKRVKYHWCHARLLTGIWPKTMTPHIAAAKELADLLGAHHDLAVLQNAVTAAFDGHPRKVKTYLGLAERRQAQLEAQAFDCGRKLLAEKPSALTRRWGIYWEVWRTEDEALHLARAA